MFQSHLYTSLVPSVPQYESFGQRFPFDRLCVSFEPASDPDEREKEALIAYVKRYGELPPMNRRD